MRTCHRQPKIPKKSPTGLQCHLSSDGRNIVSNFLVVHRLVVPLGNELTDVTECDWIFKKIRRLVAADFLEI